MMKEENFEIIASPHIINATCPKDRSDMIEIDDNWFSKVWYCKKCKKPYKLKLVPMKKWNKEGLKKELNKINTCQ